MMRLTVVRDHKHCAQGPENAAADASAPVRMQAQAADDAVPGLRDYVQISNFVTKVLIYKRFRRSRCERELTNLKT